MSASLVIDVVKSYPGFTLKAKAEFRPGVTALFGPSGAGKTTLLNLISGVERPDEGAIGFGGETFFHSIRKINRPPEARRVGYVFQDDALFPHMTVEKNLSFGARKNRQLHSRLVAMFDLEKLLERYPANLSGGEKKRVAIARALLSEPDILLLDEPLANIDARRREAFFPYLDTLRKEIAMPVIYVSHQVDDVIRLADDLAFIRDGGIISHGPLADVYGEAGFQLTLGRAGRGTLLEAKVTGVAGGIATLDFGGGQLLSADERLRPGQKIRIRLLAKDVAVALHRPEDLSILNILPCRIEEIDKNFYQHVDLVLAVEMKAGAKILIHAEITQRSAIQLKLKKGMSTYALIKALAIISPAL